MADKIESVHDKTNTSCLVPLKALSAAVSAVCAGATSAVAQEQADAAGEETRILEEVIVTATKRGALSLQDVPMSITAFTNAEIELQGFKRLDDYAGQIPSLAYGRREPGGTNVIMRGCAISGLSFSSSPTTAVYLDEQPITVEGRNMDPRLVDIERVEALSGPQGTVFGEASQCGTLRIITNKPDVTEFESWVDLSGETVDEGDFGYDVSAMVNVPLVQDTLALRLVGFAAEEAGYIDNIFGLSPRGTFDNSARVEEDVNSTQITGARAALRWMPTEDWTIDVQALFQNTDGDGFGDTDLPDTQYAGRSIGEFEQIRFNPERWEDDWYQLSLTAEGNLGWADLTVTGSFLSRSFRYEADATTYLQAFQQINDALRVAYPYYTINIYDFGGDPNAFAVDDGDDDTYTFEARLSTPADSTSRWAGVVGAFYSKLETEDFLFQSNVRGLSEGCSVYYAAYEGCKPAFTYLSYLHYYYFGTLDKLSDNWWTGVYDETLEQKALFGEATFDLTDHFSITAGGRWYDIDVDRHLVQGTLIAGVENRAPNCGTQADRDMWQIDGIPVSGFDTCYTNETASGSEDGFVPRLTATYTFDEDRMVYATYSEGFRRGGANPARRGSVFSPGNPFHTYASDTLKNYELGTKTTWAGGRFQLNVTAYHMVWEDIQIQTEDPQPAFFTLGILNFPEAEIDGVEADFHWIPAEQWTLSGNVGYNDGELSETAVLFPDTDGEKIAAAGTPLPLMPEWKFSFRAQYDIDAEIWGARPHILGVYQYHDDSLNSLQGIQSIIFDNPTRTHPSYNLLNLRFGLDGNSWTAALYIDNVTNEYSEIFYSDRWAQTRASVLKPRTFGINYRRNFR